MTRIMPFKANGAALAPLLAFAEGIRWLGLSPTLAHLIHIRASQLNGCAHCLAMHLKEARDDGERQVRLDLIDTWRETGELFDARERAALAWTEAVTRLDHRHDDSPEYDALIDVFGEREAVLVTVEVAAINFWNRINVPFRVVPTVQ